MEEAKRLQVEVEELRRELAELKRQLGERDRRIAELEAELRRRDAKTYKPQPNRQGAKKKQDRRRKRFRQHDGVFRETPKLDEIPPEQQIIHDVRLEQCPCCGGGDLTPTGRHDDHIVVDIPEPKPEYHCYRRHAFLCGGCGQTVQGRGDLELPGGHVGPRARLLNIYARGHLGISLEKSCDLLDTFFGVPLSRAGALGHLAWGSKLFDPIVTRLLELLRDEPVIHADETGWRIDGKNVWAWCFANPRLAVYMIRHSRSSQVVIEALGTSLAGVLVTDFYAAYHQLDATKQRCLTHLLRELHGLREKLPSACVTAHIQPLLTLFQDAIALSKRRDELSTANYDAACDKIYERYGDLATKPSVNADVQRIHKRLHKHVDELFTFLTHPAVPPDNTACERDIRSVAAARSDGGVNRTDWGATAFAHAKSILRTCQKQGRNFLDYGLQVVRNFYAGLAPPLPTTNPSD